MCWGKTQVIRYNFLQKGMVWSWFGPFKISTILKKNLNLPLGKEPVTYSYTDLNSRVELKKYSNLLEKHKTNKSN